MSAARRAALRVLLAVERGHTTLAAELEQVRARLPDSRDRALLMEICSGTLRWQAALDRTIEARSERRIADLDPPVRAVLRLSAFQLEHLARVPARAVVHDAVDLARAETHEGAAAFVNAVLRRLTRGGPDPRPARPGPDAGAQAQLDYLSVTLSHPRWLVARWLDRYGFEATERWCRFNNATPEVTVRPAPDLRPADLAAALAAIEVEATPTRYARDAFRLEAGGLGRLPADLRSRLAIQDEGSQLVARLAAANAGARVLDLCAAPGGKTVAIAMQSPASQIVAADHRRSRVARLRQTLATAAPRVPVVRLDARSPLPFEAVFSTVLIDAPCSGLGTVRRDPDAKWARTEADLPAFAAVQRQMLHRAAAVVAPSGRLVYATCSSEPDENESVVEAFLLEAPAFALEPADLTGLVRDASQAGTLVRRGCLQTRPDLHGLDAYFAAVLVRREPA